ncbi:peptide chain release factor N(5)-glutamine methyltransferase [bacterium]|nr:peptide chain release factor N(5)-glutamine methyltransferase [bacterium]MCB2178974.1 peptide chain release factor N(5)-glutamine methyltransferase [bacterium]
MKRPGFSPYQMKTLSTALADTRKRLTGLTETASLDAQVLLAHVTGRDRTWVLAHPEYSLDTEETIHLADALAQLSAGVPLPYVLGEWEFFGLPFVVTPRVLIPRPETELLVEIALSWMANHPEKSGVIEVGTGSGCIAVSLAANRSGLHLTATDISPEALEVARRNAQINGVAARIDFQQANLLDGMAGPFDLICANLPYIPTEKLHHLPIYLREPTLALDGGESGLEVIERLLAQAAERLAPGGLILLEIEDSLPEETKAAARRYFPQAAITAHDDLAGLPRIVSIQQP